MQLEAQYLVGVNEIRDKEGVNPPSGGRDISTRFF